jgi:LemA protein
LSLGGWVFLAALALLIVLAILAYNRLVSLAQAARGVFALVESYPQLKADQNFLTLQAEIAQVESDAQNARRYYNAVVRDLNTAIESFPSNLVAAVTGFRTRAFFELERDGDRAVPRVSFDR